MIGKVRVAAFVGISMLVATTSMAQQAGAPAQPAATATGTTASGAAPQTVTPNVATVSSTNGRAMLNRASVYEVAKKDQRLQAGDRLVVLEGGAISVQFNGGCTQTIDTAMVYTVPATPPCAPGATERGVRAPAPVAGSAAAQTVASGQYLKWGLVAVGVATPLILLSNSSPGSPISP